MRRILIYALITAIIEAPCIVLLYFYGYPNDAFGQGSLAWLVALNIFVYFLWGNAMGSPGLSQGSLMYNPLVQLVGGIVGMFMIATMIGEGTNWLRDKLLEITGSEREILKFKKQLDSAIHDFVETPFLSKQPWRTAETRIKNSYSLHPDLVIERLFEILDRVRKTGTAKTAARMETLIKELQQNKKNEQT